MNCDVEIMKKIKFLLLCFSAIHFNCSAQKGVEIKYSIKNETTLVANQKEIEDEIIEGFKVADTISFENKTNLKLSFFDDKILLENKVIYCFENAQYYESLLFANIDGKEYLYIYPHYFGRTGPYIWFGLGVLIEVKINPVIKENIDYFEDEELSQLPKFKKFKVKKGEMIKCTDGSITN